MGSSRLVTKLTWIKHERLIGLNIKVKPYSYKGVPMGFGGYYDRRF